MTAEEANAILAPPATPPFLAGTEVSRLVTTAPLLVARTYVFDADGFVRGSLGSWTLPVAQLRGMSHAQYLDFWSLPIEPGRERNNSVAFVLLPAGIHIWSGTAGPIADENGVWGNGGGVQYFVGREANQPPGSFQTAPDMFYTTPQPLLTLQKYGPRVAGATGAVAAYLDSLAVTPYSDLDNTLVQLDVLPLIDTAGAPLLAAAVQSIGPERHASTALSGLRSMGSRLDVFARRGISRSGAWSPAGVALPAIAAPGDAGLGRGMAQAGSAAVGEGSVQAWFDGGTSSDTQDDRQDLTGYSSRAYGALGGIDARMGQAWAAGIGGGVADTPLAWNGGGGDADVTMGLVAGYVGYRRGRLVVDGALGGGRSRITTRRRVAIPGVSLDGLPPLTADFARTAESRHSAWTVGTQLDAGVDLAAGAMAVQPFAGVAYARYSQGALAEDGGGSVSLAVDAFAAGVTRVRAGVRLERAGAGSPRWRPEGQLVWSRALGDRAITMAAGLRDAAGRFRFDAPADARDELAAGLGLVGRFGSTVLRARYDGRYSRDWRSHGFTVAAAVVF